MLARRALIGGAALGVGLAVLRAVKRGRRATLRAPHVSQTESAYADANTRILILGGGFGGLEAARSLDVHLRDDPDVSVLVVDTNNSMLFTPLLWTVADGRADPNDVVVPIRMFQRGRRFHVLKGEIQRIDLERHTVQSAAGPRQFDYLVLALGSVTAVPDLPGLREHVLVFHTPADAMDLRNRLIDAVEAAHNAQDPQERREWLTFVVSGGGDTGVELAAVIHDYVHNALLAAYPWLEHEPVRIVVVGRAPVLVPMSDPPTSSAVRRELEAEGVEVLTGAAVEGVDERSVRTSIGAIPARTVFWVAGITAPRVVRALPVKHASNGAVLVDDRLRVPDYHNVFVVGDAAWAFDSETRAPIPPTAQAAQHMGRYVGNAIAADLHGRDVSPFRFSPLGHLALLGARTGVARVGPIIFSGIPAWLFWHTTYLLRVPAWSNRIRLVADWLLCALVGRETGELRIRERAEEASMPVPVA